MTRKHSRSHNDVMKGFFALNKKQKECILALIDDLILRDESNIGPLQSEEKKGELHEYMEG